MQKLRNEMKRFYEKNLNCWYGAYIYVCIIYQVNAILSFSQHMPMFTIEMKNIKKFDCWKWGYFSLGLVFVCLRFFLRIVIHAVEWESNVHTNSASLSQHPYSKGINGDCSHAFLLLSQLDSMSYYNCRGKWNKFLFCVSQ